MKLKSQLRSELLIQALYVVMSVIFATPYGWSKVMTERMLQDVAASYPFNYCA